MIDNFEHEYTFVGNDGATLYFKTDLDAPRGRLIAIDLDKPAAKNWREIIPQADATLVAMSFVGDRFIASYLQDVAPLVKVFSREGRFVRDVELPGIGAVAGFGGKRTDTRDVLHVFQLRHAAEPLPLRRRQRREQRLPPRRR